MNLKELEKALNEIEKSPNNHGYSDEVVKEVLELKESLDEIVIRFKPAIENLNFAIQQIQKSFNVIREYSAVFESNIEKLEYFRNQNWFIGLNLLEEISISEIFELISENDSIKTEKYFIRLFEDNMDNLFDSFTEIFPDRATNFLELKKSYTNCNYSSVVLLSYSLTDGITNSVLGKDFFTANKINENRYELIINEYLKQDLNFFNKIYLQFTLERNEMTKHYGKNPKDAPTDSINRHLTVHGHSFNFGSKSNAVRAIFLLNFVINVFRKKTDLK